jgi:DNA polymerase-3 subunit beta
VLEIVGGNPILVLGEGQAALRFEDGTYVTTRLTEGSFPDYVQIIPKEYVTHATLLCADLLHALKMTSVFANKFLQVTVEVKKGAKELVLSSDSGEAGKTVERVQASIDGEDLTLSFNQRYIIDPLPAMTGESVVLNFAGIGRPLVFTGVNEQSVRYLVMPMNK